MDVAIVGGGASGLMAALTAAEEGHRVVLLERQARVGRKLLTTGNGRCNLGNRHTGPAHYHGEDVGFMEPALRAFGTGAAVAFFEELGLAVTEEASGRLYPFSDTAGSVVDVLRLTCDARGVETVTGAEVSAIRPRKGGFLLTAGEETRRADRVIVAAGGMAGGRVGGTRSGYELLRALGHSVTKLYPSLVQLRTDTTYIKSLKGVRADAGLTLTGNGATVAESAGEVQFTEYGLSGPAVFDLSRAAAGREGLTVTLDLMRPMAEKDVLAWLRRRVRDYPALTVENLMTGLVHNRLGRTLARAAGLELTTPLPALSDRDLVRAARTVKAFSAAVTGTMGFDAAQVTAGGVRTAEFDPETLESRLVPGLYAAGEVLDIDGDCGGYNLQWAWASGRLAGRLGAGR